MTSVLFVCTGNICRSPTAEAVFRALAVQAGVDVMIDSAGTSGWHAGEPPDRRARDAALRHGYRLTGIARQVRRSDFINFDLIVAMDTDNYQVLVAIAPPGSDSTVRMLVPDGVPDPYYGGERGFDQVIDIVEGGCRDLLAEITAGAGLRG